MKLKDTGIHIKEEFIREFLLDEYRMFLKVQGLTYDTIGFYISYIHRFFQYSKITDIRDFKNLLKVKVAYNKLFDRNLKNSSVDKYRKSLIKYYSFLVENEIVEKNYAKQLTKVKIAKQLPSSLSEEEIARINTHILQHYQLDFYRYRAYMIFNIILNAGLRRSEVIKLKKASITPQYIKVINGKGQKDRIIYIPKAFSKQLQDYLEIQNKNEEYVFCTPDGRQLGVNGVNRIFRSLRKELDINVYPHLVRHTYASLCVKRGINIYTVKHNQVV